MAKSEIKVSVISPIYNTPEKMLRNNIEHLISQTLKDIEIILVDDGSEKETADICDEYAAKDSRIIVIHQKNRGLSGARNSGQDLARGEYVVFLDGDDYLEYDALEAMAKNTADGKNEVIIACVIKDYGGSLKEYDYSKFVDGKTYKGEECKYLQEKVLDFTANISTTGAKLYRRDFLENNNIRHKEDLRQGAEGIEFLIRVFENSQRVFFMRKVAQHYIYNDKSITERHDEDNHERVIRCFEEIESVIKASDNYKTLHEALLVRLQYVIVTMAISGYFSPTNTESFLFAKQKYYGVINRHELLQEAFLFKGVKLDAERRIILFMLRNRLCISIRLIAYLRRKQKKSYKK